MTFWHSILCDIASQKASLSLLRPHFLPLGGPPHPIWSSSKYSSSATRSAVLQAKILVGTYRCDAVTARWTGESHACSLGHGCSAELGDSVHLLSGQCPALQPALQQTIDRGLTLLKSDIPLLNIVEASLQLTPVELAKFLADPSTSPEVISHRQQFGQNSIFPIFRFARSYIWTMHKQHMQLRGLRPHL